MERTIMSFETAADFEAWLEAHETQATGIWLLISKKGAEKKSISYAEALECALCFGWIDGQKAKQDESNWLQYFSKRKKNSLWSQVNRDKANKLLELGRLRASGKSALEEAKKSGRWDAAYQPMKSREIPQDLERALNSNQRAKDFFESLSSQNRFSFVFRIATAKKPEIREKKLKEFLRMLENGEVFHPQKKSSS
ncbi:MAG: bacteriocin-protection protein [Spirochaetales bacterium]|nr:bacteriocin-protection protein [Spirochaetales bacterium]